MMAKSKLLLITTFFPPRAHTATQRTMAWIKYLDHDRFDIEVLCPFNVERKTEQLESEFNIKIHQIKSAPWPGILPVKPYDSFLVRKIKAIQNKFFLNTQLDEWPAFTSAGLLLAQQSDFFSRYNYVLSSYAPIGPHLIAEKLKSLNPNLKWIADFRDEMSLGESIPPLLKNKLFKLEARFVQNADYVIAVSAPLLNDFRRHDPAKSGKFIEIKNGYDFEPIFEPKTKGDTIKIGYFGTLYGEINLERFFKVWERTLVNNQQNIQIELHLFGNNKVTPPDTLRAKVVSHGPIPYRDVPQALCQMDAFLLVHPSGGRSGIYTSKIFDYLAVNRPILGLVNPKDVAGLLIQEMKAGLVFKYEEFESPHFHEFITFLINFKRSRSDFEKVRSLHRKYQIQSQIGGV